MKKFGKFFFVSIIMLIVGGFMWGYYTEQNREFRTVERSLFNDSDTFRLVDKSFTSEFYEYRFNRCYNLTRRSSYQRKLIAFKLMESDLETHTFTLKDDSVDGKLHQYEFNLYYNYQSDKRKASKSVYEKVKNQEWQFVSSDTMNLNSWRNSINKLAASLGKCE